MALISFCNTLAVNYSSIPVSAALPTFDFFRGEAAENFLGSKSFSPLREILEKVSFESWDESCAFSVFGGAVGSAITRSPLPLIMGVSECWAKAAAYSLEVLNPIPNYRCETNKINYHIPNNTFSAPDDSVLIYSASLTDGTPLPKDLKFHSSSRKFEGYLLKVRTPIRVTVKDPNDVTASSEFIIYVNKGYYYLMLTFGLIVVVGSTAVCCAKPMYHCTKLCLEVVPCLIDYITQPRPAPLLAAEPSPDVSLVEQGQVPLHPLYGTNKQSINSSE